MRSPPKITQNILRNSKRTFESLSRKLTFPLNFLEICLLCAVINSFKISEAQLVAVDVQSMYIHVIDSLLEIGIVLPPERGTLDSLYNESPKFKKDFRGH